MNVKRRHVRSTLLAAAAVVMATAVAGAQGEAGKVEIKTHKIASNLYTLDGQGGTIGVLVGPDGVLMVDSQMAPLSEKIVAAIKAVSDGRIRFLIDTHFHSDHTGGNENFGRMGVTIVGRDQIRPRLMNPGPAPNGAPGVPTAAVGLPAVTFEGTMTFHMNGEEVRLVSVPAAHTDTDTMVFFKNADVLMTGDLYRSVQYPFLDRGNGGSLKGFVDGLDAIVGQAGPATKIVPGHGPTVDRAAVSRYRDVVVGVRNKIAPMVQAGMTLEQVLAAKPTAEFDGKVAEPGTSAERFAGQVYAELKGTK